MWMADPLPIGAFTCEITMRRIRPPQVATERHGDVTYIVAREYELACETTLVRRWWAARCESDTLWSAEQASGDPGLSRRVLEGVLGVGSDVLRRTSPARRRVEVPGRSGAWP